MLNFIGFRALANNIRWLDMIFGLSGIVDH